VDKKNGVYFVKFEIDINLSFIFANQVKQKQALLESNLDRDTLDG
jgi:hypothetical protein